MPSIGINSIHVATLLRSSNGAAEGLSAGELGYTTTGVIIMHYPGGHSSTTLRPAVVLFCNVL
jgi:hypothetical protein